MFDIGFTELLVVGVVALIVVGPKDLPGMFRTLGRFTAKAKSLGQEFNRAMNDAAEGSGMSDVVGDIRKATSPKAMGLDALNKAAETFEGWDPTKPDSPAPGKSAKPGKPAKATKTGKAKADTPKADKPKADKPKAAKPKPAKSKAAKPKSKSAKGKDKPAKPAKTPSSTDTPDA